MIIYSGCGVHIKSKSHDIRTQIRNPDFCSVFCSELIAINDDLAFAPLLASSVYRSLAYTLKVPSILKIVPSVPPSVPPSTCSLMSGFSVVSLTVNPLLALDFCRLYYVMNLI
ncbi:hypothetical protein CEXT_576711 [Caerostris extrusa]|uniref:Uncharacterized protein n=1 Tax=Caerostris extrusa TaxID=172846 RepID=A0AAV4UJI9_CAEEX|nr:hypothetical protein CEXT_576711 [Caerostris extrusa]